MTKVVSFAFQASLDGAICFRNFKTCTGHAVPRGAARSASGGRDRSLPSLSELVEPHRRARFAQEPVHGLRARERLREQELNREELAKLEVARRHYNAHIPLAEDSLDAIFASKNVPLLNGYPRLHCISPPRGQKPPASWQAL